MRKRTVIIGVAALCLMFAGSAISIATGPIETETAEEPDHSATDRKPRSTISSSELFDDRAISPPSAPKITTAVGLTTVSKYRIRPGDVLGTIAKAWHINVSKLACRNGIQNPDVVFPGKWIYKNGKQKCTPVAATVPARRTVTAPALRNNSVAERAIQFAIMQVGDAYVIGGDGPDVWDCSGLVHAAFAHAGVHINRTTKTLINDGYAVSQGSMQRGDLVFPSSGHVGIYLGDGQMVHSPQPGETVKVSDVYAFYAARRVV